MKTRTTFIQMVAAMICLLVLGSPGWAQTTTFTDADATDSLITNPLNWDNGLPTNGVTGTIEIDAQAPGNTAFDGYTITQTGGTLTRSGGSTTAFLLGTGSYEVTGGAFSGFGSPNISAGGSLVLQDGTLSFTSGDTSINGSLTINGGTMTVGRRLIGNGIFTINGGVVNSLAAGIDNNIGGNNLGSGKFYLNGGDIDFRFMQVGNAAIDFFFGGTTAGNLASFAESVQGFSVQSSGWTTIHLFSVLVAAIVYRCPWENP